MRIVSLRIDCASCVRGKIAIALDTEILSCARILNHHAEEARQGGIGSARAALLIVVVRNQSQDRHIGNWSARSTGDLYSVQPIVVDRVVLDCNMVCAVPDPNS